MKPVWISLATAIVNPQISKVKKLTKVNDELQDLQHGDVLLPPNTDATSTLEVVPVHHNVNQQVDRNGHPLHGGQTDELGVAKEGGSTMVVRVEEGQGLLLENQENSVQQFNVLVDVVEL